MVEEFKMDEIYHHGIKGQKWGVRRTPAQLGYKISSAIETHKANQARISRINDRADAKTKKIKADAKTQAKILRAKAKAQYKIDKASDKAYNKLVKASTITSTKDKIANAKNTVTDNKVTNFLKRKKVDKKLDKNDLSKLSDEDIANKINRVRLENTLKSLQPEKVSRGKAFLNSAVNDVIMPSARDSGKKLLTNWLNEKGAKTLGLDAKDSIDSLRKEVEKARLKKELSIYKKDTSEMDSLKERNEKARLEKEYNNMTDASSININDMNTWTRNMNTVMNYQATSARFNEFVKNNTQKNYTDFVNDNDDVIYQGQRVVAGLIEDKRR